MKVTKKCIMILSVAAVISLVAAGVGCKESEEPAPPPTAGQASAATIELCTSCGYVKGSESCCKADQEKCGGCSLTKGSPGCCKIPEGIEKAEICTKCGQIAGTDTCCKPDQPKCEMCGLVKGAPGCCLQPKI
jgi:hypothetical protein